MGKKPKHAAGSQPMDRRPSNPVSKLNNLAQKNHWRPPLYEIIDEHGPDHDKEFVCVVKVDKFCIEGTGKRNTPIPLQQEYVKNIPRT